MSQAPAEIYLANNVDNMLDQQLGAVSKWLEFPSPIDQYHLLKQADEHFDVAQTTHYVVVPNSIDAQAGATVAGAHAWVFENFTVIGHELEDRIRLYIERSFETVPVNFQPQIQSTPLKTEALDILGEIEIKAVEYWAAQVKKPVEIAANILSIQNLPNLKGKIGTALGHENLKRVVVGPLYPVLTPLGDLTQLPKYNNLLFIATLKVLEGVIYMFEHNSRIELYDDEQAMVRALLRD